MYIIKIDMLSFYDLFFFWNSIWNKIYIKTDDIKHNINNKYFCGVMQYNFRYFIFNS